MHPEYRKMSAINRLITKKNLIRKRKVNFEYRHFKTAVKSHFLEIFCATEQKSYFKSLYSLWVLCVNTIANFTEVGENLLNTKCEQFCNR